MQRLKQGDHVFIESYKHNGKVHRIWAKALVVEVKDKQIVAVTDKTCVIESDGRRWITKEPAVCFFYEDRFYNVISMARKNGIYYYCNLASPSIFDGEAIKNIDYDLDIKVFPDYSYIILDEYEYAMHAKEMGYDEDIKKILEHQMQDLIDIINKKKEPFDHKQIEEYLLKYFQMIN